MHFAVYATNRVSIVVRPCQPFIDWANTQGKGQWTITLAHQRSNPLVILLHPSVLQAGEMAEVKRVIHEEFLEEYAERANWPKFSEAKFDAWFDMEISFLVVASHTPVKLAPPPNSNESPFRLDFVDRSAFLVRAKNELRVLAQRGGVNNGTLAYELITVLVGYVENDVESRNRIAQVYEPIAYYLLDHFITTPSSRPVISDLNTFNDWFSYDLYDCVLDCVSTFHPVPQYGENDL